MQNGYHILIFMPPCGYGRHLQAWLHESWSVVHNLQVGETNSNSDEIDAQLTRGPECKQRSYCKLDALEPPSLATSVGGLALDSRPYFKDVYIYIFSGNSVRVQKNPYLSVYLRCVK